MCSNYEIIGDISKLKSRFKLQCLSQIPNKKNIRPANMAPVLDKERKLRVLTWGIPRPWQDGKDAQLIINARAETVAKKSTFRPFLNRRCLVPATAWFEWRKSCGKKLKNRIYMKDKLPFTFAGLASENHFTIITCESTSTIAHIHKRMPLVLTPDTENNWLDIQEPFESVAQSLFPQVSYSLRFDEEQPAQFDLFT